MRYRNWRAQFGQCHWLRTPVAATLLLGWIASTTMAQDDPRTAQSARTGGNETAVGEDQRFSRVVQPLLETYCQRCHNPDNMKSGIRVDQLTGQPEERHLFLWENILAQIGEELMPPDDEPQPTADERKAMTEWIQQAIHTARTRQTDKNGTVRRLTVTQYRSTLRDLLGLAEDVTKSLPPDGISQDGFANNAETMVLSPLQVESFFNIAERALELCIVDEESLPTIQNFRVELGKLINPSPSPDSLILGANSFLLNNPDFVVTQLTPPKPFPYQPFVMRTAFEFIEGYVGNDTVREWRKFDSIYHAVFACMRGTPGYPKGKPFEMIPGGLLLRPAIPSSEIFGVSNTYGPMANFKISLRELPDQGNFRITVHAARYNDALLLDAGEAAADVADEDTWIVAECGSAAESKLVIPRDGIYQVDVYHAPGEPKESFSLELDGRYFSGQLPPTVQAADSPESEGKLAEHASPFMVVRLPAGRVPWKARYGDNTRLRRLVIHRVPENSELAKRFTTFEQRSPSLGVHLGLRRDCGSTLNGVGEMQPVLSGELQSFVFEGAINDFPSPDVEQDNVNYLAGIREIGIRSEFTDGRDMPRLLIKSIEFEGPFHESWPSPSHQRIFIDSANRDNPATYAREVIRSFARRAFRRPVTTEEEDALCKVFDTSQAANGDFRQSIQDALLVVLTSPQFLFLIENSQSPEAEVLDPWELASKLSYFLWNTAPDEQLLQLAEENRLHDSLDTEISRMIQDPRFDQFAYEFASQWLALDKFDVVAVDVERFPELTRDVKTQLRREPVELLKHLIQENLPVRHLVKSDFIMANEVVAGYYDLADRTESGFRFVPVGIENDQLGGVLSQASILAGLSDGREANPVKRGAWLARKIIAEPPDDPPPNVPQLPEDDGSHLTLREKLERHRNQEGCAKCHQGIDPWGLPFEAYEASGLFRRDGRGANQETQATLPDGTEVADLPGLKDYLAGERIDQVAYSFLKHLATYAVGRSLTYNELAFLKEEGVQCRPEDYRAQDLIRFIVKSDLFLTK